MDRMQENVYLKIPYWFISQHHLAITPEGDPFPENGPQAVYPLAAIAYYTGSLRLMRWYQFVFCLIVVGMTFRFFFRKFKEHPFTGWEVCLYVLLYLVLWLSIPLSMVYPTETNGMTAGFIFMLLGILAWPTSPLWGMFYFGWAFTFKGQYLAFLPGFIVYLYFIDIRAGSLGKHLLQSTEALAMFFVPKTIILSSLCGLLGMFYTRHDFFRYALDGPYLMGSEFSYMVGHLLGQAKAAAPEAAIRRTQEFSGFDKIMWGHIFLSLIFCAFFSLHSLWKRFHMKWGNDLGIDKGLTIFAWGGLFYWINYLFFYRFPYWYNIFAVIYLNLFLGAALVHLSAQWTSTNFSKRLSLVMMTLVGFVAARFLVKYGRHQSTKPTGDAFVPYEWMRKT
jgi:hypothetical protein